MKVNPEKDGVFERVRSILMDLIAVREDEVVPGALLIDDLGADSLDLLSLINELEKEFSEGDRVLEITDEDAEDIETVQQVVDMLVKKGVGG